LLNRDPSLARCHYAYRTPIYFAVRENQLEVSAFLLDYASLEGFWRMMLYPDDKNDLRAKSPGLEWNTHASRWPS
jgi:hypothetical protein